MAAFSYLRIYRVYLEEEEFDYVIEQLIGEQFDN